MRGARWLNDSQALRVLSVRCSTLLEQLQGLDAQLAADREQHGALADLAFAFRQRKAALLRRYLSEQPLLPRLLRT